MFLFPFRDFICFAVEESYRSLVFSSPDGGFRDLDCCFDEWCCFEDLISRRCWVDFVKIRFSDSVRFLFSDRVEDSSVVVACLLACSSVGDLRVFVYLPFELSVP